jgi:hypothetical protein
LLTIVPAALVLLSTTTRDRILIGAAASYQLLFVVAAIYPMTANQAPSYFVAMVCGHLLLLAALVVGLRRVRHSTHEPAV